MDILAKIRDFVKQHFNDIIMFVIIASLVMLAFAAGFISAKYAERQPIRIEKLN